MRRLRSDRGTKGVFVLFSLSGFVSVLVSTLLFSVPNSSLAFQSNYFATRNRIIGTTKRVGKVQPLYSLQDNAESVARKTVGAVNEQTANDVDKEDKQPSGAAQTNTINERLMEELREATDQERSGGGKSSAGKKLGLDVFRSEKSEEEREAAIAEARNLNGVNPAVALAGSAFAFVGAIGLWTLTNFLAEYFVLHPIESNVFVVERLTAVMRNVLIGIVTLASGFFAVTGLGIFLLGVRVAYGVMTGELDPTPIKKSRREEIEMPNVWDLMMNKKPGRRR